MNSRTLKVSSAKILIKLFIWRLRNWHRLRRGHASANARVDINFAEPGPAEFGYELIAVLPYAYALYKQGRLGQTVSGLDTKPLYYFSTDHQERDVKRSFAHAFKHFRIPNIQIHKRDLDWELFIPPPLKRHYKHQAITFEKETIVICNRVCPEWDSSPINFFSIDLLKSMFNLLADRYQVVYVNTGSTSELRKYDDHFASIPIADYPVFDQRVLHIQDLMTQHQLSLNETLVRVFAGCEKFITMNGGLGILASYFGGENIIYTKKCHEIHPSVNSFYGWYHRLGNSLITQVSSYEDLLRTIEAKFVRQTPLINVLVRTHNRKRALRRCLRSIEQQTYKNYRILVSTDNVRSYRYARKEKVTVVPVRPRKNIGKLSSDSRLRPFAPNLYLNELAREVTHGLCFVLDDDNIFHSQNALELMATNYVEGHFLLFPSIWGKHQIPSKENYLRNKAVAGDFDSANFCVSIDDWVDWTEWRRGDYRVGVELFRRLQPIRVNEVCVRILRRKSFGTYIKQYLDASTLDLPLGFDRLRKKL